VTTTSQDGIPRPIYPGGSHRDDAATPDLLLPDQRRLPPEESAADRLLWLGQDEGEDYQIVGVRAKIEGDVER
jgi:hypothetical protein